MPICQPVISFESRPAIFRTIILPLIFSLLYACVLTSLPLDQFKDRQNYLAYASSSDAILMLNIFEGWTTTLANEPLWLALNIFLGYFTYPDNAIRVIIFVPAFIFSFTLIRNRPQNIIVIAFFLIAPQVVKNHVVHLRQGVAVSVFILGYFSRHRWLRLSLMGASGLIHASFLIISMVACILWVAKSFRFATPLYLTLFLLTFPIIGILLLTIGDAVGARQAEVYREVETSISGIGFLFWASIFLLFLSRGITYVRSNDFAVAVLLFYLCLYFFVPLSARIFESAIFIVFLTGLSLGGWRGQIFVVLFFTYSSLSYLARIDQPWLGWGLV